MENILDLIVPLIFVLVFVLNSFFKSEKDKEKERKSPTPPIRRESDPLTQLREEIRRRIEVSQGERKPVTPMQSPKPVTIEPTGPTRAEQNILKQSAENREVAERMRKMQRMQEQVSEMQRRADAEKYKAASTMFGGEIQKIRGKAKTAKRYQRSQLVGEVVRDLRKPYSSRKAVLNSEILGTPIGLRKPSQTQALWEA